MKIGILCPSEIAMRRFLPALSTIKDVTFCGVGVNSVEERYGSTIPSKEVIDAMLDKATKRARIMTEQYGGKIYSSYNEIIKDHDIEAIYIPLPPALHYKWAKKALEYGKHVLVEKPATVTLRDTLELTNIAESKGLALHENYMFIFHEQLQAIDSIVNSGEIGGVRLYRISFGFPMRQSGDFRYIRSLGGGALLDAGGYTIKCASYLLGETARVICAHLNNIASFEVDMYGSGVLVNEDGTTAQIAFGMDNEYKCELEVWGSKGTLLTGRIMTAPAGFVPTAKIIKGGKEENVILPADDAFRKSIERFISCIEDESTRTNNYEIIRRQAKNVQAFVDLARK